MTAAVAAAATAASASAAVSVVYSGGDVETPLPPHGFSFPPVLQWRAIYSFAAVGRSVPCSLAQAKHVLRSSLPMSQRLNEMCFIALGSRVSGATTRRSVGPANAARDKAAAADGGSKLRVILSSLFHTEWNLKEAKATSGV